MIARDHLFRVGMAIRHPRGTGRIVRVGKVYLFVRQSGLVLRVHPANASRL